MSGVVDLREAGDIRLVRAKTGSAHVSDADALEAISDGRGVFDVDPHCRKLDAFIEEHGLEHVQIGCEELLTENELGAGKRPVYFVYGWTRRHRPRPPRRPAVAMRLR